MRMRTQQESAFDDENSTVANPNLWLRLTSHGWDTYARTIAEREKVRRSRLVSWIGLALFLGDMILIPVGTSNSATFLAIVGAATLILTSLFLNRLGYVSGAGILLILTVTTGLMVSLAGTGSLALDALPAYDLLVFSTLVGATVLPRRWAFIIAALNIVLTIGSFYLLPHYIDLTKDINDPAAYPSPTIAVISLLARPVALQVIVAVVAYLWVRGTEDAIHRADRAEEIAALEHQIAAQKQQLEYGMQQILQTHVRAANGDLSARAPLAQDNMLWQIAQSLNNLLTRLQRAGGADFTLQRTEEELRRLAAAIDDANAGRQPIWPSLSGTPADIIIERITRAGGRRQVSGASQMPHSAQLPSFPSTHESGQAPWSQALPQQPMHQEPQQPWGQPAVDPWQQSQQDPGANPWNLLPGGN